MQETDRQTSETVVAQALDGLRHEIRLRVQEASRQTAAVPETEWLEIVELLRRRFNTFGMMERSSEVDEFGMDALAVRGTLPVFDFLLEHYWRVSLSGVDRIPVAGPVLFAAKCFTTLPCEPLLIAHAVYRKTPHAADALPSQESTERGPAAQVGRSEQVGDWVRFLIAPQWAPLPFVQAFATRLGGLPACLATAQRLLQKQHRVVCSRAAQPVLEAALELGVPIVPVALQSAPLASWAASLPTQKSVIDTSVQAGEELSLFAVLRALGFLALPMHWSLHFEQPIETRAASRAAIREALSV